MASSSSNSFRVEIVAPPTNDLDSAIAALNVGDFVQFKTSAQFGGVSFIEPGGGGGAGSQAGNIGDFAHKGVYDATRKKVFLVGANYNNRHYYFVYDQQAASGAGTWSRTTIGTEIIHIWDHLAYNPASGHLQYYDHHGFNTYRINVDTGSFSTLATNVPWGTANDTSMHTFFDARNEFIAVSRSGVIKRLPAGSSTWSNLTSDGGGDRGYQAISAYDSIAGVYYYGGGSNLGTSLWKLTAAGSASIVTSSAPTLFVKTSWLLPARNAAGTAMDLLVFNRSAGAMSRSTNGGVSWSSIGTMPSGAYDSGNGRMFGIPLVNHSSGRGIIMFVNAESSTVWLYRNS